MPASSSLGFSPPTVSRFSFCNRSSVMPSRFSAALCVCKGVRNQEQFSLALLLLHSPMASASKYLQRSGPKSSNTDSKGENTSIMTGIEYSGGGKHTRSSQQQDRGHTRSQSRRLKTDEEIHFEALEHYRPNYDDDHAVHYAFPPAERVALVSLEDSKKNGETVAVRRFSTGGDQREQFLSRKRSGPIADDAARKMQCSTRSPLKGDKVSGDDAVTLLNLDDPLLSKLDFQQLEPLQKENQEQTCGGNQNRKEEFSSQDIEVHTSNKNLDFNLDEKIKAGLENAAAVARQNMCKCEKNVMDSEEQGLSFPRFESLLVEDSWMEVLSGEFQKPYMERLYDFVSQEAAGNAPIHPPPAKLFNAFNSCPFEKVKVVIIGQDPYHGAGQAMGLCFSVEKGMKLPSSLANIFLEIETDLGCGFPSHGNLEKWAYQGVLLLNVVLTVRDRQANSHAKKGWELFTDAAIRALATHRSGLVFLLWGNAAQQKLRLINRTSHHILMAPHPSGMSARKGFFNCRHFSKTNQILVDQGLLPIDWQL